MDGPGASSPPITPTSKDAPEEASKLKRSSSSQIKKRPEDFIFGKVIGEGSYSTVYLAKEVSSGKEYAIKVLDKKHILKEKKQDYVMREKEVFSKLNHPFFVTLYFTFQDVDHLYFGLSYAKRGELLNYINKLGCFDDTCTRFYAAEIVLALEHLHGKGIIHRDLKPENILLNEQMHIQITDFGSTKIMNREEKKTDNSQRRRKNSFVGTAQYVSPEILEGKPPCYSSDLWALGCIIYQLISGSFPFYGSHEYQIFQKITKLEYDFPEGFHSVAKDLVQKLLVLNPAERLGCEEMGGYGPLKAHSFFEGIEWESLDTQTPPEVLPYLPAKDHESENLWSQYKAGFDEQHLSRLISMEINEAPTEEKSNKGRRKDWVTDEERKRKLDIQRKDNQYHKFVEDNLILKQGVIDKRKGLFARRRMFLLTEGPHLYYVDPQNMVLKGQIPWSKELRPEAKNFKIFFVHTPNRTYYLEDPEGNALKWCKKIEEVYQHYYDNTT